MHLAQYKLSSRSCAQDSSGFRSVDALVPITLRPQPPNPGIIRIMGRTIIRTIRGTLITVARTTTE